MNTIITIGAIIVIIYIIYKVGKKPYLYYRPTTLKKVYLSNT